MYKFPSTKTAQKAITKRKDKREQYNNRVI